MRKILKILACFLAAIITAALSFTIYAVNVTASTRFDSTKLITFKENTVFYDNQNKKMADTTKHTVTVKLSDLPSHVKHSFIAIEDKRFYSHKGIDYRRIFSAAKKNVFSRSLKEGASTISQQLIKNTHLSNEKTIKRKLKEIKLTLELEKKYSKDEILEMYLNTIYFGDGAYGIQSAASNYFSKDARDLTIEQSALLAAIIKAPSTYSPFDNPEKALKRRNLVLRCMKEQGYISPKEYEACTLLPLSLNKQTKTAG